jgi:hypothetical protein
MPLSDLARSVGVALALHGNTDLPGTRREIPLGCFCNTALHWRLKDRNDIGGIAKGIELCFGATADGSQKWFLSHCDLY